MPFPIDDPINIDAATRYNKVCDVKRYMVPLLGAWNLGIWYRVTYLETWNTFNSSFSFCLERVGQGVLVRFDTRVNVTRHFPLIAAIQGAHSDFSQFPQFNTPSSSSALIHQRIPVYGSCYVLARDTKKENDCNNNNTRDSVKRVKRDEWCWTWREGKEREREWREKGIGKTRLDWTRSRHSRKKTTRGKSFFEFQIIPNGSQFVDPEFHNW